MKIEESDGVKAARERMDRNKDGKIDMADLEATGIRNTIIEFFGIILWVSLAIGLVTAVWQLVTLKLLTALMTFVTTIVSVGVGFVVLDIRDRLIGRL